MKLKEKLAIEYATYVLNTDIPDSIRSEKEAFLAGFDEAREMALKAYIHRHSEIKAAGEDNTQARIDALDVFVTLGEEDVE